MNRLGVRDGLLAITQTGSPHHERTLVRISPPEKLRLW